jgi:hypothetical protein
MGSSKSESPQLGFRVVSLIPASATWRTDPVGDIDESGTVDIADYRLLKAQLGGTGPDNDDPTADLNGDGLVSLPDFAILRGNLGETSFTGDWALANWSADGAPPLDVPIAAKGMIVNSGTAIVSSAVPTALSLDVIGLETAPTATPTVDINSGSSLTVTDAVTVGDRGTLNVNGTLNMGELTVETGGTLIVGAGSVIDSPTGTTITINGTIANDADGVGNVGDPADLHDDGDSLTLADNSTYEWTFGGIGVDNYIDVRREINIEIDNGNIDDDGNTTGVTIKVASDGSAIPANDETGLTVILFRSVEGIIIDGSDETSLINLTFGNPNWVYEALTRVESGDFLSEYLVITNLRLGATGPAPITVTPEPATMSLLAIGGLALLRRRRRK